MYRSRDGNIVNKSPWEIGASHYNQRDLFTQNARIDAGGYGRGPSNHPPEGSYAYHREAFAQETRDDDPEHVAWPITRIQPDDAHIEDSVRRALLAERELHDVKIDVTALHGAVTLEGTVDDAHQKRVALEAAGVCPGVTEVHDRLRVRGAPWDPFTLSMTGPVRAT